MERSDQRQAVFGHFRLIKNQTNSYLIGIKEEGIFSQYEIMKSFYAVSQIILHSRGLIFVDKPTCGEQKTST